MRVRKLTVAGPDGLGGGDMTFGQGSANYWVNDRRGVGQVAGTRLGLWLGQWFLDVTDGTPWQTEVLGKYTDDVRDMVIQERIYGTPGVTNITGYNSQLARQTRAWTVNATLSTLYGQFQLQGPI